MEGLKVDRYPATSDKSLLVKNAADDYLLSLFNETTLEKKNVFICNDRFGYLTCHLDPHFPQTLINYKSQEKSIESNLFQNGLSGSKFIFPLSSIEKEFHVALIKIPKSFELFRLYLYQIHQFIEDDGKVFCGFMTKYFSPQMLAIAAEFFENIDQSLAVKKSRVLTLSGKKDIADIKLINELLFKGDTYKQYLGVFSASNIDYATQFFLENLRIRETDNKVLDLASGNGVIGSFIKNQNPDVELHLIDDSYLAVESSKLNVVQKNVFFHFNDSLDDFENEVFDLVVSNPPFHFDFETNTEVTFSLFKQVYQKLKREGSFQLVANRHLAYKPVLENWFQHVEVIAQNNKFIVYSCLKK